MLVEFRTDHVMIQADRSKPAQRVPLADLPELLGKLNAGAQEVAARMVAESKRLAAAAKELKKCGCYGCGTGRPETCTGK